MDNLVTIEGIDELQKKLQQLRTDSPGFERRLRGAIKKVLAEVRSKLTADAKSGLQMESDPRKAYKAVRYAVYKRILGGQVNILNPSYVQKSRYNPPKKLRPGQRGGNRIPRSDRTQDLLDYYGASRAFVLRFLNAGTEARYNGGRNGRTEEERFRFIANNGGKKFRGSIAPRNWFGPRSHAELEAAAHNIQRIIDRILNDEFV